MWKRLPRPETDPVRWRSEFATARGTTYGTATRAEVRLERAGRADGGTGVTDTAIAGYDDTGEQRWSTGLDEDVYGDGEYGNGCTFADAAIGPDMIATKIHCQTPNFAAGTDDALLEIRELTDGRTRHRGAVLPGPADELLYATPTGVITATGSDRTTLGFFERATARRDAGDREGGRADSAAGIRRSPHSVTTLARGINWPNVPRVSGSGAPHQRRHLLARGSRGSEWR